MARLRLRHVQVLPLRLGDVDSRSFATAYAGLRRGGRLVLVALPASGTLRIPVFDTVLNGTSVVGSIVGTRADLTEVFLFPGLTEVVARELQKRLGLLYTPIIRRLCDLGGNGH